MNANEKINCLSNAALSIVIYFAFFAFVTLPYVL